MTGGNSESDCRPWWTRSVDVNQKKSVSSLTQKQTLTVWMWQGNKVKHFLEALVPWKCHICANTSHKVVPSPQLPAHPTTQPVDSGRSVDSWICLLACKLPSLCSDVTPPWLRLWHKMCQWIYSYLDGSPYWLNNIDGIALNVTVTDHWTHDYIFLEIFFLTNLVIYQRQIID